MLKGVKRIIGFIHHHPLAGKHLFAAWIKFLTWQIRSALKPGLQPVRFIGDTRFMAKKGLSGITGNIYTGLHEFEDMAFLLHFTRENDLFFDVGANVGSYTLLASGHNRATTIAFEPSPETYAILKQNIVLNGLKDKVTLVNKGVGSTHRIVGFSIAQDATNHVVEQAGNDTAKIEIVPLDDHYPAAVPDIMKIDVEGFESEVISGASKLLADGRLQAIIIELNGSGGRYGFKEDEIHDTLLRAGFKPYSYAPFDRKLIARDKFGNFNTIYIKDLNAVQQRLSTALAFSMFGKSI